MISDLIWRIATGFIRFMRLFDTNISVGNLWKIRIYKLVNCWSMSPAQFLYSAMAGCRYTVKRNGEKEDGFASMETPSFQEIKISEEKSAPRACLQLYLPFKTDYVSIQLKIACYVVDHEEYLSKTIDVSDLKPGIHYISIFLEDVLEHYKQQGMKPW